MRLYSITDLLITLAAASLFVFLVILLYKEIDDRNNVSFREKFSEKSENASRRASFFLCEYRIADLTKIEIKAITA
jgi:hypothetical protein